MTVVSIITPYCNEDSSTIDRCVESVANQTVECRHYLIADLPATVFNDASESVYRHISLGEPHKDYGNTPRAIGALLAISEGADAVCFLDADDWLDPDHVETCLSIAADNDYVVARRRIVVPDGTAIFGPDEPIEFHVDTNCFFFLRGSFHTLPRWALQPKPLAIVGDRIFLRGLDGLRFAVADKPTVTYTSNWFSHYKAAGQIPPPGAKKTIDIGPIANWWRALPASERTVNRRLLALPGFDL